jgi:hypothetical protein
VDAFDQGLGRHAGDADGGESNLDFQLGEGSCGDGEEAQVPGA